MNKYLSSIIFFVICGPFFGGNIYTFSMLIGFVYFFGMYPAIVAGAVFHLVYRRVEGSGFLAGLLSGAFSVSLVWLIMYMFIDASDQAHRNMFWYLIMCGSLGGSLSGYFYLKIVYKPIKPRSSHKLALDICKKIECDFRDKASEVHEALEFFYVKNKNSSRDRVVRAVIYMSGGNIDQFHSVLKRAHSSWRDVLYQAEHSYPEDKWVRNFNSNFYDLGLLSDSTPNK